MFIQVYFFPDNGGIIAGTVVGGVGALVIIAIILVIGLAVYRKWFKKGKFVSLTQPSHKICIHDRDVH